MAIYIELHKIAKEDKKFVHYRYEYRVPGERYISKSGKVRNHSKIVSGEIKINKKSGKMYLVSAAEGDDGFYWMRAASTLRSYWEEGEFPEKTFRAS